jgi:malate synthase
VFRPTVRFEGDRFDDAATIVRLVALEEDYPTFLTVPAYAHFLVERAPALVDAA